MGPSLATSPGQRKLSEVARHVCRPDGIVSTGWPAVRDRLAQFGIPFDLWQQGAGRLVLAKRGDGMYAAGVGGVVISIPRQVGKTYMIGWIVFALCTLVPGLTVIWTAHHGRTTSETFGKMRAMANKAKVKSHIETIRSTNGEQAIVFRNTSRILFGARDQGFGLGFDMVDVLVLDEAQRVKEVAMADMVPATNAAPNGLVILMGTPPRPTDTGDVFAHRRADALDGDPDTLYLELSADPGAKIIDWDQVAKANPSFPHRTTKTAILRMQKLLGSDEGFYREGYGIWDDDSSGSRAIDADSWRNTGVASPPRAGTKYFGVAFSLDGGRVALSGAVKHDDSVHVELVDAMSGDTDTGIQLLAGWLAERAGDTTKIAISGKAGAVVLAQALRKLRVSSRLVHVATTPDYFAACAVTLDAVQGSARVANRNLETDEAAPLPFTHLAVEGQAQLDESVAVSDKLARGKDGSWGWASTTEDGDETPLEAMSLAYWAATVEKRSRTGKAVFA